MPRPPARCRRAALDERPPRRRRAGARGSPSPRQRRPAAEPRPTPRPRSTQPTTADCRRTYQAAHGAHDVERRAPKASRRPRPTPSSGASRRSAAGGRRPACRRGRTRRRRSAVAPQPIFVQAPEAPRPRGNRAAAGAIGLLAALSLRRPLPRRVARLRLHHAATSRSTTSLDALTTARSARGSLWVPVVVFFIALLAARRDHQPRPLGRTGSSSACSSASPRTAATSSASCSRRRSGC